MAKKILAFLAVILIYNTSYSQAREEGVSSNSSKGTAKGSKSGFDMDNVVVGGGFGLQFGTITLVEVSPTVAYRFTDNFLTGIGGRYTYFEDNTTGLSFSTNIYGGSIFSQYFFLDNFLAHTEYEILNLQVGFNENNRANVSSFFVGGGYRSPLGANSYATIIILYDLNDDINSPYVSNPIIRFGFAIGL